MQSQSGDVIHVFPSVISSLGYFDPDPQQDVGATGDCRWNFDPQISIPDLKISACLRVLKL